MMPLLRGTMGWSVISGCGISWPSIFWSYKQTYTVKTVLSDHSKIDKIKVLMTDGSLMNVECIAECSLGAFCNTFDMH